MAPGRRVRRSLTQVMAQLSLQPPADENEPPPVVPESSQVVIRRPTQQQQQQGILIDDMDFFVPALTTATPDTIAFNHLPRDAIRLQKF